MTVEYKCVPLPSLPKSKSDQQMQIVMEEIERLLNEYGRDGWHYVSQETFVLEQATGLFGKGRPRSVEANVLLLQRARGPVGYATSHSPYPASAAHRTSEATMPRDRGGYSFDEERRPPSAPAGREDAGGRARSYWPAPGEESREPGFASPRDRRQEDRLPAAAVDNHQGVPLSAEPQSSDPGAPRLSTEGFEPPIGRSSRNRAPHSPFGRG